MSKTAKTLHRFEEKIQNEEFYEAHQMLRTIANRYVHSKKYSDAIELIFKGSLSLFKANQSGSGVDLTLYLLEVYKLAEIKVDDESVGRLIQILQVLPLTDPDLKDVATGMNNWSCNNGDSKFGDARLHDALGRALWNGNYVYEAERYWTLGTRDSRDRYVKNLWDWYLQSQEDSSSSDKEDVSLYLGRLVFNYLFVSNISYAIDSTKVFLNNYIDYKKIDNVKHIDKTDFQLILFDSNDSSLNFLQLLILACQTKEASYFNSLKNQYPAQSNQFKNELEFLGQEYFGIVAPKQSNFLQDMMSGLLGGGK
ncbi:hypothetical protein TBLA_0E03240 [Henningerozyma blattae CBS 6284]|uniref:Golgi to ER traffic protein 4 n=1 Tax=Henningerozyma blattae (strain ATCC 34711 / CBS 6284 / DSM 70876 / NBRC 10599 / NRRL Y-10934 / UCD 77-7) TaxID=1071380 RepID=I2H4S6_HENB6|nr:hypothetical protein TBLA_0E03240 [Tetrapisispora blattae CBS 6284]CCH61378.1 hypothetical protein TBLA_0E03240 [Tetrapisispora blattae CBS 6284]